MKLARIIQTFTSFEFLIAQGKETVRGGMSKRQKGKKIYLSSIARSVLDATMKTREKWPT